MRRREKMELLHFTAQRQGVNQRQPQERTSASQIFHVGAIFLLQLWKGDQKSKSKIDIYYFVQRSQIFLFSWFWSDMIKTHLFWIKLIFFFQSGSLVVLYPYLVIHMRSLGLSVEEVWQSLLLIILQKFSGCSGKWSHSCGWYHRTSSGWICCW